MLLRCRDCQLSMVLTVPLSVTRRSRRGATTVRDKIFLPDAQRLASGTEEDDSGENGDEK